LAAAAAAAAAEEGFSSMRLTLTAGERARVRPPRRLVVATARGFEGGRACGSRGRLCGCSISVLSDRRLTIVVEIRVVVEGGACVFMRYMCPFHESIANVTLSGSIKCKNSTVGLVGSRDLVINDSSQAIQGISRYQLSLDEK